MTAAQKAILACLAILVGLVGLGVVFQDEIQQRLSPRYLDTTNLERELDTSLERIAGGPVDVTCQQDVPLERGKLSDCRAVDELGATYYVRVTQDDDEGRVSWQLYP